MKRTLIYLAVLAAMSSRDTRCTYCGKAGHRASQCPSRKD